MHFGCFLVGTITGLSSAMAKWFAYLTMAVIVLIYVDRKVNVRCCKCWAGQNFATISTVIVGKFSETIPQTGKVNESGKLVVPIDELYKPKIKNGLPATATLNNTDVRFHISQIDSTVIQGRFSVIMDFTDTLISLNLDQSVRLRIELSEPREGILIPVGGFYKDTGGAWIYVVNDQQQLVKRNIKLGPRNPEYFLVLQGLSPGDKVLTSSYENFTHNDTVSLWEFERKKPLMLM
jgi:hypothetical protein